MDWKRAKAKAIDNILVLLQLSGPFAETIVYEPSLVNKTVA